MNNLSTYNGFLNEGADTYPGFFPTVEIDKALGTKLSVKYKMPSGKSEIYLQSYLLKLDTNMSADFKKFNKLYNDLIKLNPELSFSLDGVNAKWAVIQGAISRFHITDIRYWVIGTKGYGYSNISTQYKSDAESALNKVSDINPDFAGGYLPSPSSLKVIAHALKLKSLE